MKVSFSVWHWFIGLHLLILFIPAQSIAEVEISGELKMWHTITLTFDGPSTGEEATPNPFTDYRLNVTFKNDARTYVVPGYYAADGDAAQTSAKTGNKWRVHFNPDKSGNWIYTASFRTGPNIAISTNANDGTATSFDSETGNFTVVASNKSGKDFRGKGRLEYADEHYLQFQNSREYFIKGGTDSPENFFAYTDFDGTVDGGGSVSGSNLKTWSAHTQDFNEGDPTWKDGKGKGIIGAINYLSESNVNSAYIITHNVNGDGFDTWPWIDHDETKRFDVSKLDQWNIVVSHMMKMGVVFHIVLGETENTTYLATNERKLYYRQMVARFAGHPAIIYNMQEEFWAGTSDAISRINELRSYMPYQKQHIVIHNGWDNEKWFGELINNDAPLKGTSMQVAKWENAKVFTEQFVDMSAAKGKKWVVCIDEMGGGVRPDGHPTQLRARQIIMYPCLFSGSAGVEWYFGWDDNGNASYADVPCEDLRTRDELWKITWYARDFMQTHLPFRQMKHSDNLISESGECFAKENEVYAIYLPDGGTNTLDLSNASGEFIVKWFDPRNGGDLKDGSVKKVNGGDIRALGNPPEKSNEDWVILVKKSET